MATAALVLSPFIRIVSVPVVAISGALIACAAHLVSVTITDFILLAVIRFTAGLGVGLAIATCAATVAQQPTPEKTYANVHSVLAIVSTLTLYTTGYVIGFASYSGLFLMMASLCLIAIPVLNFLPPIQIHTTQVNQSKKRSFLVSGMITTLAVFLFSVADIATWTFIERIAQRAQLSSQLLA